VKVKAIDGQLTWLAFPQLRRAFRALRNFARFPMLPVVSIAFPRLGRTFFPLPSLLEAGKHHGGA
jgi:hypothetical protein